MRIISMLTAGPITRRGTSRLMLWIAVILIAGVSLGGAVKPPPHLVPSREAAQRTWEKTHDIELAITAGGASGRTARRWRQSFNKRGTFAALPKSGRPPAVSGEGAATALQLLRAGKHGAAHGVAVELKCQGVSEKVLHRTTINRIAKKEATNQGRELVVETGKPKRGLSPTTKRRRTTFASEHLKWLWNKLMFSDRSKFRHWYPGQRVSHVRYRFKGEPSTVQMPNTPHPCNVYQGITPFGVTRPITVTGTWQEDTQYRTTKGSKARNITKAEYNTKVLPALLEDGNRLFWGQGILHWWFQQDNDPAHADAARIIEKFNRDHGSQIHLFGPWPSNSPDLNPIENVWAWISTRVEGEGCKDFAAFKAAVKKASQAVPQSMLKHLYSSMPKRMAEVLKRKGEKSGY